tara:strand:- start:386 stop:1930 length:1545 start_codon:yes stop_codon:yes gene_type:complete
MKKLIKKITISYNTLNRFSTVFVFSLLSSFSYAQIYWAYGEYTGNGNASVFNGVGFQPDLIMIKSEGATQAVIVTKDMTVGETKPMGSSAANSIGRITTINSDGFSLGTHAEVNSNGIVYQWIAFQDGGDIKIGTYLGTGSQTTIDTIGFKPEMIWFWGDGASSRDNATMYLKSNSEKTDRMKNGARSNNMIGNFSANGYSTGTSSTYGAFRSGINYYYIAFNAGIHFEFGGYNNGNPVDGKTKTLAGSWKADLIITNGAINNLRPVFKTGTMIGDETLAFSSTAVFANGIQSITSTGFTLGTNHLAQDGNNAQDYAAIRNGSKPTIILPVKLSNFDVFLQENKVEIKWTTASEINNDYFQIERSSNGIKFQILKIIQGAGNSNQVINYSSYDLSPPIGNVYYRVRQIDFDGENKVSDIKSVFNRLEGKLDWKHINESGIDMLNISGKFVGSLLVKLLRLDGSIQYQKEIKNILINSKPIIISLPIDLKKGIYLVNITGEKYQSSRKILIQGFQ